MPQSQSRTKASDKVNTRRFVYLLLLFVTSTLCFQNCNNSVQFQTPSTQPSLSGNGDPYSGKPDPGEYVRRLPGYVCQNQERVYQSLTVREADATLHSVDPSTCADVTRNIPLSEISARTYNPDLIAYQEAGFEKKLTPNAPVNANDPCLETWCRTGNLGPSTADVVIHEDIVTGFLSSKLYSSQGVQQDVAISKIQGAGQIVYKAPDLSLTVDRSRKVGQIVVNRGALTFSATTQCLTAGWLDPIQPETPSFSLNFSSPVLPPSVAFARVTSATYVDGSGVLRTSAADQPRFKYGTNGASLGLLVERDATNLLLFSEQITNPVYMYFDASGVADQAIAPDGTNTADALREGNGNVSPHVVQRVTANQGASHTCSAFIKPNGRSSATVKLQGSSLSDFCETHAFMAANVFEPSNLGVAANCQAFMEPLANGWFRVGVSGVVNPGGGLGQMDCIVFPTGGTQASQVVLPYLADGRSALFIWGFQLETGAIPTSYIATTTAPVSRGADSAVVSTAGWFNAGSGSLWAVGEKYFATPVGSSAVERVFSLVSTGGDQTSLYYNGTTRQFGASIQSGVNPIQWNSAADPRVKNNHKFVMNYGGPTVPSLMVDGAQSSAASGINVTVNANSLQLGGLGSEAWNGSIKAITYWPTRLPDNMALQQSQ